MEASVSRAETRFTDLDKQTLNKYHCRKRVCVFILCFLIVASM